MMEVKQEFIYYPLTLLLTSLKFSILERLNTTHGIGLKELSIPEYFLHYCGTCGLGGKVKITILSPDSPTCRMQGVAYCSSCNTHDHAEVSMIDRSKS